MMEEETFSFPLHRAVKDQDIEKVNELLSSTASANNNLNLNAEDSNGYTPLIEACVIGNETLVKMLLQAGCPAQPTTISSTSSTTRHNSHHAEETPLRAACMAGQSHIIPILLEAGSDPNIVMSGGDDDGNNNRITTPLMGACNLRENVPESKSALCTKVLLDDPRTDPTLINSFGETALDLAISRNYEESIAMIKQALKEAKWLPPNYVTAGIPYWLSDDIDHDDHDDTNIKEEEEERRQPYRLRRRRQPLPSRDDDENSLIFPDYPEFRPNLSPDQVLKAGSFGGTYFRSIVSKTCGGRTFPIGVHLEFPTGWFEGLDVSKMVTSSIYRKEVNKYNVKSGNDLNFWEQKGWMREQDPYGWFQWYCRFYLGRRSQDDPRQVSRWIKAIGNKGRWRTFLVGQCVKADKGWDDYSVSPVTRQTLLHWGYELTESDFNSLAPAIRKGKSVIYMGVVSTSRTGETATETDTNDDANSKSRPKRRRRN